MSRSSLRRTTPSTLRRTAATLLAAVALTACASDDPGLDTPSPTPDVAEETEVTDQPTADDATESADAGSFPVTVTDDAGEVTIEERPEAIVSLSPTSTEMLFAIGAGNQVVAVDDFSNFPEEAPTTDLSGFTPNVEAILGYEPDLVILSGDSNDVVAGLTEAGVPVLQYGSATDLETAFAQFEALGTATGNDAEAVVNDIQQRLDEIAASTDVEAGTTYYHELSSDLFTATSSTFIGEIYGLFDMENIADAADTDGSGYPQLSAEYIVEQDPDYVFLACTVFCGETADSFCSREGFGGLTACAEGNVVELNDDHASRWGPRMVDFAESVAGAVQDG